MIDYPEKPKRGDLSSTLRTLEFVSPSPIDGCITLLKRQAYDVWGDQYRVNLDSITLDEWVIQVFTPTSSTRYGQLKLIEGRLRTDENGGTRISISEASTQRSAVGLFIVAAMFGILGMFIAIITEGFVWEIMLLFFLIAGVFLASGLYSMQNPKAKILMADIERLLRR